MWQWLKGPGQAFREPLAGSTNYLSAYDKQGNLIRLSARYQNRNERDEGDDLVEDEETAAKRDQENPKFTEEEREARAAERESRRATKRVEDQEKEDRNGIPKERLGDLRPYPLNHNLRSEAVLSEELREQLYQSAVRDGLDLSSLAGAFGVDVRRVAAVVRLKTIEKQWEAEGKKLATPYSQAVLSMLPQTHFHPGTTKPINIHEPVNDLPVHPHTRTQLFYPTSESRQFTREDAAKAFSSTLLPADKRIPLPMLVDIERWKAEDKTRQERAELQQQVDLKMRAEQERKEKKKAEWEAQSIRVVQGRRWDFKLEDYSAEQVGKDGRGRGAVGLRYGMPHEDRKRGMVKIPTKVE
ncbi:hypothetical protein EJ03DRAFT_328343 [Teratosphaeria nubilosa]|uniref:Eukaryotic mitochondrial regulator protein-domain-containing protein n=1 Tax=Teratosphaeria nubilosa TaxID=161662 RepID=A0A6G1L6P7_9PEZI|nr:hypothetical protein EJ03DRAFT_328343 [Teratosphaeria nubilosa]